MFLVVTGGEALYADMGHFGRRPIQQAWFAWCSRRSSSTISDKEHCSSPIRRPSIIRSTGWPPPGLLYPLVVLATVATVIASQALISGAFSLTRQAVSLGYLPRVKILHTSAAEIGQIYIPSVNYLLMIACVGLVFGFRTSGSLAAAYGVAVTATMVITTVLFHAVAVNRWGWNRWAAGAVTGALLVVDISFLGANLFKIPAGGWFPLAVGVVVFSGLTTWKTGRRLLAERMHRGQLPIERFIGSLAKHRPDRVAGTAVYLFAQAGPTPPALIANLRHNGIVHERVVLVSVQTTEVPHVTRARRHTVHDLGDGFFQVVLRFGFQDDPNVPDELANIVATGFGFQAGDASYFLARETIIPSSADGMVAWREHLFALMHRNATSAAQYFGLPAHEVIELGIQVEI